MGAGVRLARLGAAPAEGAMSAAYVRSVFDQYAPDFDRALTEGLDYRGPALLFDAVATTVSSEGASSHFDKGARSRLRNRPCRRGVLDEASTASIGVDLSPAMAAAARAQAAATAMSTSPTCWSMRERASDAGFDLVIAADALVYLGDLAPLFNNLRRVIEPGGLFAFSVETHGGEGVVLGEKLRYAHARRYVEERSSAPGWCRRGSKPPRPATRAALRSLA